jgi:hypothetical protein
VKQQRPSRPACSSTKAWYAPILLSKDLVIDSEASQAACLFFDKSLVRSFSSFEKHHHRPVVSQAALPVFQQKPGMQLFFFRKPHQLCSAGCAPMRLSRTPNMEAPQFGCAPRRVLYHTVMVALHSQIG